MDESDRDPYRFLTARQSLVYAMKLAEAAERPEDMFESAKKLAEMDSQLSVEERNLVTAACKAEVSQHRNAWRVLSAIESVDPPLPRERSDQVADYRRKVVQRMTDACSAVQTLIDKHLLPNDPTLPGQVFYLKMSGDYYRYMAELMDLMPAERYELALKAKGQYEEALSKAKSGGMLPSNAVLLSLGLNYAVFLFEIMANKEEAISVGKRSFDAAVEGMASLGKEDYENASIAMERLRENLLLWSKDPHADEFEDEFED